jgi:uncharacterized protein YndB with AHSA1/START domain
MVNGKINVTEHVNAVRRTVGARTMEAGEARVVTLSRAYATDADDLWDACTNAERIPRWFLPVTGDLEIGGRYQLEGNASGTVLSCDPPRSFTATWEFGGQISWIELRVSPDGAEHARMELDHIAHVDDELWAQYGPGAVGIGWDLGLIGLSIHLATGDAVPAGFEQTWTPSPDGQQFVRLVGESWYQAQVAAGDRDSAARAAADSAVAFYLGEAPPQN